VGFVAEESALTDGNCTRDSSVEKFEIVFPGLPHKHCFVQYGRGLFERAAEFASSLVSGRARAVIVSDETIASYYGERLLSNLNKCNLSTELIIFPPGESNKTWETLGAVLRGLVEAKVGRDGFLIALGGGVTGDIGGLAAALHCRGIDWMQLPTTTLAMADSALGGKTAVNLAGGKNLAGAFHQPAAVFADLDTLATLPLRHFRAGLAEVVKTAVMLDGELFSQLESSPLELLEQDNSRLERALLACARLKAGVVTRDEREAGERALLNAGHTIGHALEAAASGLLLHGEAVAVGLVLECRLAEWITGFPPAGTQRMINLLQAIGLPTIPPEGIDAGRLAGLLGLDKKARRGMVRFALPADIGKPHVSGREYTSPVEIDKVMSLLGRMF
jgi:3-dehydroquinate synthase